MLLLKTSDEGFEAKFAKVVRDRRESDTQVGRDVASILNEVRERGDRALVEYTTRFDGHNLSSDEDWSISKEACEEAYKSLDADLRDALETAGIGMFWYHPQAHDLSVFLHDYLVQELGRDSYGVFWNNLALTRPNVTPAVLLELGFMINPEEFEWITDEASQRELVEALADAIQIWLERQA